MRRVVGPAGDAPRLINADAERALMRIKQKLAGTEHGVGGEWWVVWHGTDHGVVTGDGEAVGVEGQVRQLLSDATDPDLLCRMYVGWAPWL